MTKMIFQDCIALAKIGIIAVLISSYASSSTRYWSVSLSVVVSN